MRRTFHHRGWLVVSLIALSALACDLSTVTSLLPSNATATPRASTTLPTQAAAGYPAKVTHKDAAGDCLSNSNNSSVVCNPRGVDIVSATVSRPDAKGVVTVNLELAGNGVKDLKAKSVWALSYAFDLDRNISTGMRDVFPAQHRIGPEFTLIYGEASGSVRRIIKMYDAAGKESDGDASLVAWSLPDDNHIQVVLSGSLFPVEEFFLVGDITTSDMYDHFVENGYLSFPDGQAVTPSVIAPQGTATTSRAQAQASPSVAPRASPSASNASITNAVLARDSSPLTSSPLGITDTFPPDAKVHVIVSVANAPSGTQIKAVWSTVDVGSAAAPNTEVTNYQTSIQGTLNVDVFFSSSTRMPLGSHKIEVYLNGKLDRTLNFTVKEGVGAFRTPTPKAIGSCVRTPPAYKPPLIATKLTTAESVSSSGDPVNVTRQFKPSSTFYAIATLENAPADTKVKAIWFAVDTGGLEACNARIAENEITTSGSRNVWFSYKATDKFPVGSYKVEIYTNGNLNNDLEFSVK